MSSDAGSAGGRFARTVARAAMRTGAATLLLAVLTAIGLLMVFPRVTDSTALTVLTGSMTPEIPVGSAVYIRPVDTDSLQPGDVATYQRKEGVATYVTHRVVRVNTRTTPTSFIFKGDANRGEDVDPVPATAIRGEVWFHVPYLGAVRDALNGKAGLTLLATLVLGGYALSQGAGALRDRRRGRSDESSAGAFDAIECDRPVVVAELPTPGVDAQAVADEIKGVVLHRSATSCIVMTAAELGDLDQLLSRLADLGASRHRVMDAATGSLVLESTAVPHEQHSPRSEKASHASA